MLPANTKYNINDTIVAVCSGQSPAAKKIIRISGDKTFDILNSLTNQEISKQRKIAPFTVDIDGFEINGLFYFFVSPNSYTGEDLVEIHLLACGEAVELLFSKLLSQGCRSALAGEFTYRAYINGKIDLSRAEAVAQLIESSNQYQLSAAQKLFSGSIEQKVNQIRQKILDLLSLIEAGLDFSAEDIEIISQKKAIENAGKIQNELDELLSGSITFEQISQAPSVVIVGTANAGKSSLVNAIVGENRSIVSDQSGTTRDVLEHWLKLERCDCVLFDCAGLVTAPAGIIQSLANEAVLKAVKDATVLIFCVDITKEDYSEDMEILKTVICRGEPVCSPNFGQTHRSAPTVTNKKPVIFAASKCDLLKDNEIQKLKQIFGCDFLETSSKNLMGIDRLKEEIQENIIRQTSHTTEAAEKTALTERHRQAVNEAIKNIKNASVELKNRNEEIAAFVLRAALQNLSSFDMEHIDEKILETIFSRFCIGK